MDTVFLEQYYEKVILAQFYSVPPGIVRWKDHGKVGPDAYAHYFEDSNGSEFVLVNEDFPGGDYLSDNLTHSAVPICSSDSDVVLKIATGNSWIPNISGYFTLYKEKR